MKRKTNTSLIKQHDLFGLVFMIPWFIGFLLFFLYPFIHSVFLSFQKVDFVAGGGYKTTFIGVQNYLDAFTKDENFIRNVTDSLLDLVINVPVCLVFAFFAAVLLNQNFHGNFLAKTVFFLPVILGTGVFLTVQQSTGDVSGMALNSAMDEGVGAMQGLQSMNIVEVLKDIGIPANLTDYITKPVDRIYSIITINDNILYCF